MLDKFVRFLTRSPTVHHAAREIGLALAEADFTPLSEGEKWELEPGKSYFLVRDNTLLASFRLPLQKPLNALILANHIDSPALKVKPHPESGSHEIGLLGTEGYGGPLLHTWLDRDLAIGGRIVVINNEGHCENKTVLLDDYPVIIPSVAIHLNREVNEKGLIVHKQDHLKAIFSIQNREKHLEAWLKKHHSFKTLLSSDLFLVPIEKPSFIGFNDEMIASYRLDNLTSAFACLEAILQAEAQKDRLQIAIFWDHEEIGSKTYTGADSIFMNELLERICLSYKMDREDYYRMKSASLVYSCDVGHAYHPNFPEKYDPQNAPFMGKGPVVKFSTRYATNGATAAPIIHVAGKHNIPIQTSASRSDLPGGSTVGSMMGASLGIATVDLGIGIWAMHSIRETMAAQDQVHLTKLLQAALVEPILRSNEPF